MVPDLLLILLVALHVVATLRDIYQSLQAQHMLQARGTGKSGLHRGSKVTPLDAGGGGGGGDGSAAVGRRSDSYRFTGGSTEAGVGSATHLLVSATMGHSHSGTVREKLDAEDAEDKLLGLFPESKQASVPTLLPQGKGAAKSGGPVAEATQLLDYIRGKQSYGNDVSGGSTCRDRMGSTPAIGRESGGSASSGVGSAPAIGRDALLLATAEVARQRLEESDASDTLGREAAVPGGPLEREELS